MFLQEEKQLRVLLCKSWRRGISGSICKSHIKEPGCMEHPALQRGILSSHHLLLLPFKSHQGFTLSLKRFFPLAKSLRCRPGGRGMRTPCTRDALEGDGSGHGDHAACESELMCTRGAGPPTLYISWAAGGTLAKPQAKGCPSVLPRWDMILRRHCSAWGECKMPRVSWSGEGLNAQILRFGCRKVGSTGQAPLAVMG